MKNIRLQPSDTLFFRDGKPFSMGEDTWADAVFPPYPSVVYGTLRTAYGMANNHITPDNINKETADLNIQDLFLVLRAQSGASFEKYYPLPLDLASPYKKKDQSLRAKALIPRRLPAFTSQKQGTHLLLGPDATRVQAVEDGLISIGELKRYLNGDQSDFVYVRLTDYVVAEPKVGIARDNDTRTTEEGKLYRVGMLRTENCQIGVAFSKKQYEPTLQSKIIRMGAEGKVVSPVTENFTPIAAPTNAIEAGDCFRVWLATPAILEKGNMPDLLKHYNIKATFLAGVTGRYLSIGGWDLEKRRPKPMCQAVPGGSVWHFRAEETINLADIQGKSLSAYGKEQGFGIAYFGIYNKELYD